MMSKLHSHLIQSIIVHLSKCAVKWRCLPTRHHIPYYRGNRWFYETGCVIQPELTSYTNFSFKHYNDICHNKQQHITTEISIRWFYRSFIVNVYDAVYFFLKKIMSLEHSNAFSSHSCGSDGFRSDKQLVIWHSTPNFSIHKLICKLDKRHYYQVDRLYLNSFRMNG